MINILPYLLRVFLHTKNKGNITHIALCRQMTRGIMLIVRSLISQNNIQGWTLTLNYYSYHTL